MSLYCDGVWDLFHPGHVRFLQRVRELADARGGLRVVVGVISDADAASYKRPPVMRLEERAEVVAACRHVDRVVPASPLVLDEAFLRDLDARLVAHGDDDTQDAFFGACRELMVYLPYTRGVSTTDILGRLFLRGRPTARRRVRAVEHCAAAAAAVAGAEPERELLRCADTLNPVDPPDEAWRACCADLGASLRGYPSAGNARLERAVREGVFFPGPLVLEEHLPAWDVVVGAGASELIVRLVEWLHCSTPVRTFSLGFETTYAEYEREFLKRGFLRRSAREEDAAAPSAHVVVNPNNPTGESPGEEGLLEQLRALPSGSVFISDESMLPFLDGGPETPWARQGALAPAVLRAARARGVRVVQVVSLTKVLSCCKLRLGFLTAEADLAEELREMAPPWPCGGAEESFGARALEPSVFAEHLRRTREAVPELRAACASYLQGRFPGCDVQGSPRLPFLWVRFRDAAEAAAASRALLQDLGVTVRSGAKGYEKDCFLRVNAAMARRLPAPAGDRSKEEARREP